MNDRKKIMILVPHQDDELILCGNFFNIILEYGYKIYVVYMTNGDYEAEIGKIRLEEALEVLKEFGLSEKQIIFMGYANEYEADEPHIYNAKKGQIVRSQFGNCETYGLESHSEYCFIKYGIHHTYCRENLTRDLLEILQEIKPDIIFSTDAEIHPDHKANSLFLDEVLGKILQTEKAYSPVVLKKPEYATSWFHPVDYSKYNNKSSILYCKAKVNGETSDFYNPYIRWNNRTRLPIDLSVQSPIKKDNSLWKALKQYKSQNAVIHYEQMLNSDVTFWARRSDSLTYHACIETSSGNGAFLNDYKIFDSNDIRRTPLDEWTIGASIWHPEKTDVSPYIKINWKEKRKIASIVIYQEFCPISKILKSHIVLEDGKSLTVGKLHTRKPTVISLDGAFISEFTLVIDECSNLEAVPGLSEIEVYEEKQINYSYIKMLINDNFVYRYVASRNCKGRISIYLLDEWGFPHNVGLDQVDIKVTDLYGQRLLVENYIDIHGNLYGKLDRDIRIQVFLKLQPELCDVVLIFQNPGRERKFWNFVRLMRQIKVPLKDINELENSTGFDKLNRIRTIYRVAQIKGYYELCICLRLFYLNYYMGCKKRSLLTDYQQSEGLAFLLTGECIPDSSIYIKKYFYGRKKDIKSKSQKTIFLVGTPSHCNIGDHAITFATKKYLQRVLPGTTITEISIQEFPYMLGVLERIVNKQDMFVLQGGGNMGNVYWTNERIRREILKRFPDNYTVIFPETIYYEDTVYGEAERVESKHIYGRAKHLTICARERASYEIMRKLYTQANIILTPDIVCSYRFQLSKLKTGIIKLFFRNDKERCIDDKTKNNVKKFLDEMGEQYTFSDMLYQSKGYMGRANRDYIVKGKVREISEAKLVITDRLHVMILSVLTGTPCIVFFGYNHKIESTYRTWFSEIPYLSLINDAGQLRYDIEKLMSAAEQIKDIRKWDKDFKLLNKALQEAWM